MSPQQQDRLRLMFDGVESLDVPRCHDLIARVVDQSPVPDAILVGLERLLSSVSDRMELVRQFANSPRSLEILSKLFVGSPFLTNILLREPSLLEQLTSPHSLGEMRSRPEFFDAAIRQAGDQRSLESRMAALRRFQQGELLRIGVCDFLGLLDLRSVTNQLSLLADAIVQAALQFVIADSQSTPSGNSATRGSSLAVLALGKLGGEELNYSSDIDLVFVCDNAPERWTDIVSRLTKSLSEVSSCGLLYRVDLRLRPWGNAGPLVSPAETYGNYLRHEAQQWEKQALLKARCIAGDSDFGHSFLEQCRPWIFSAGHDAIRQSVRLAKKRIEQDLQRRNKGAGEVKLGAGTIRDIEFVVQCLQLQHGRDVREVRSINTLDGLVRLADFGFVLGDEFRELSSAYVFFRVIEHALQLKHSRQTHSLPSDSGELETLARRLDFLDSTQLTAHFQQHKIAVRRIFEKYVGAERSPAASSVSPRAAFLAVHELDARQDLLSRLSDNEPLIVDWQPRADTTSEVTIAGFDQLGDLSMICGLLFVQGFDILAGHVTTEESQRESTRLAGSPLRFLNSFVVRARSNSQSHSVWNGQLFQSELQQLLAESRGGNRREAQARLAKRVSEALPQDSIGRAVHSPVEIEFDNESHAHTTQLRIAAEDTSGFLYELTNAIALLGIDIRQMEIRTIGSRVQDTLQVTDDSGRKLLDPRRQQELRAAIVLIQHFTDLLPQSPDPEAALLHFQQLLEGELRMPDWLERITSLRRPKVLSVLAKLLGVSDLFWEDFLRLQHEHLLPVVTDIDALQRAKSGEELRSELDAKLRECHTFLERCERLNEFKDREMFRIDMRHVVGPITDFPTFSGELTTLAEVVVAVGCVIAEAELSRRWSTPGSHHAVGTQPLRPIDKPTFCIAALGKLGGRELGFASDIELLCVFDDRVFDDRAVGSTARSEFCERLMELIPQIIRAKRAGIFQIDLRLRPHGNAGSLAVSLEEFERYFAADGPAWPFERQSLIKLRPIAGDEAFGRELLLRRDQLLFSELKWDPVPVRAMRERQVRQLVPVGKFHAKLSPGALVDIEYLVQLLQLSEGRAHPSLRTPNTLEAIAELSCLQLISATAAEVLTDAYLFFRRLIDSLRMARGAAADLTLPPFPSEEARGLARRLNQSPDALRESLERHAAQVRSLGTTLGWPISPN